jgi:photosystem II stability/assembly factor-like uncharacterized protein
LLFTAQSFNFNSNFYNNKLNLKRGNSTMPKMSLLSAQNFKIFLCGVFLLASFLTTTAQTPTPEQQMPRTPGFTPSPTPQFAPAPQTSPSPPVAATTTRKNPLELFQYRQIGPYRGGRVTAVAGIATQPNVYYFGATGGGVYKTTDGGVNWAPVSDEFFKTGSVGAIGVAESDPNVVYVGMGESPVRGNVSHGDGVYKSTDAGKTWKHIGLGDTRQISRVRVHPKNADVAYVAALGHLWADNQERGVFRTRDGGKTWQRILFRDDKTGAIDLILDPTNPNTIYAGFWQIKRTPWSLESGGPGSSMYKSIDGGDTWTEIKNNRGLPSGVWGKVGVTVSPINSNRIWAMIEAKDGGTLPLRTTAAKIDRRTSDSPQIRQRP